MAKRSSKENINMILTASGKGFFVEKEGFALALREEMGDCISNPALAQHMKDILEYRTMEYYRRKYTGI